MKKNTYSIKGPKGVTLIELTVVIAVILVLISVLFVGAKFYKDSANKSACVINRNAIFKAASATYNISGTTPDFAGLTAAGAALGDSPPACPSAGAYTVTWSAANIPAAACNAAGHN